MLVVLFYLIHPFSRNCSSLCHSLNLSFFQGISDSGFAHLVMIMIRLRSVLKLGLQSTQISAAGVRALGQLPALTRLSLRECKQIDDSHCADLSWNLCANWPFIVYNCIINKVLDWPLGTVVKTTNYRNGS